jgi:outer membrane autotransporter protein
MGAALRFASVLVLRVFRNCRHMPRTSAPLLLGLALLIASPMASAISGSCQMTIQESSPIVANAGDQVQFTILPVDAAGLNSCGMAVIQVVPLGTPTASVSIMSAPTNVSRNTPAAVTIQIAAPPSGGGGSATFEVICQAGCDTNPPRPQITLEVNDIYQLQAISSAIFLTTGESAPLSVRVLKNGTPGGVGPSEGSVCFEIAGAAAGSSLSGGDGACGTSGRLAIPDLQSGAATVTFDSNGALCTEVEINATAAFPDAPQSVSLYAYGDANYSLNATSGNEQSAFVGQSFANPLVVTLTCGSTLIDGEVIDFDPEFPPEGTMIDAPASVPTVNGIAQVTMTAGSQPGFFSVRASVASTEGTVGTLFESFQVQNFYEMVHATPASTTGSIGVPVPLGVELSANGAPAAGREIIYSLVSGPQGASGNLQVPGSAFTQEATGVAIFQFIPDAPGVYVVQALFDELTGSGRPKVSGASPLPPLQFTITVGANNPTLDIVSGDGQSALPGEPLANPLGVIALNGGIPPSESIDITWTVSPQGAATIETSPSSTGETGESFVVVTLSPNALPGQITITATRSDSGNQASFSAWVLGPVVRSLIKPETGSGDGQSAPVGSDLPLPLQVIALDDGDNASGVTINWSVTGDATLSAAQTFTDEQGGSAVSVSFGVTPGVITVVARRQDEPAASTSFVLTAEAVDTPALLIIDGDGQTGLLNQPARPLSVQYSFGGAPQAGVLVNWTIQSGVATLSSASSSTGADGTTSIDLRFGAVPGPVVVRAQGGDAFTDFLLNAVAGVLSIESGNGQSAAAGSTLPQDFVARISAPGGASVILDGVAVAWEVLEGGGTLATGSSTTDASGLAANRLTLGAAPGNNIVRASIDGGSAVQFVATSVGPALSIVSGSAQRGPMQTTGDFPLVVALLTFDGQPLAGRTVQWQVLSGPVVLDANSSQTDASGRATIGFRYGDIPGAAVIRVTSSDAAGFVDFTLESLQAALLGVASGDGQTGRPGRELAQDFVVAIAPPDGKALGGVTVFWEVIEGGGTLRSPTSLTDAAGLARNRLTLGPEVGTNRVVASIPGGGQVVFTAQAVAPAGQLRIISGNSQTLPTNDPSAPLVVEVVDANGVPLDGVRVRWTGLDRQLGSTSTPGAEVADEVTLTNAQGRTSTTARVLLPGAARVEARTIDAITTPVVFSLNAGVVNIPGLTEGQRGVSNAIDNACPALAALANRTAAQEDLYQRCLELINNAGVNPDEVRRALDQIPSVLGDSMVNAAFGALGAQFSNHSQRFELLRKRQSAGNNQFNIALWTPTGVLPLSFLPSAIVQSSDDSGGGEVGSEFDRWGFFATGTIGRGKSRGQNQTPGFEFDTSGITAGVDYRFSDRLVGGMSVGYTRNDSEIRGGDGNVDTRGWLLSGYASWFNERNWYADGVLSYGSNDYALDRALAYTITALNGGRTVVDQRARGDSEGSLLGTAVSIGRDFQRGAWSFSSYLRGNYSRVELDAYEERMLAGAPGAGLALRIDARTLTSVTSALGGKATWVLSREWGVLMPHAQLEWEHEFRDSPANLVARFAHDPTNTPIATTGSALDSDYFNVGVGISALFPGGRAVYVYYEQLMGASRLSQGTLSLGARFEF